MRKTFLISRFKVAKVQRFKGSKWQRCRGTKDKNKKTLRLRVFARLKPYQENKKTLRLGAFVAKKNFATPRLCEIKTRPRE
ncbi:hypothetical protein EAH81_24930 [Flavobacterium pectinovorum]|uniref:Uncharacterized protein n=1 Tax=Flavobacterium pectinovorum TaxID=29533 RepID=A0A502E621_9FLAO|nr:hypothetical protein EAH81_24930 [Flavobacterium pectinovorum]